jgi:hypothetical protein
MSSPYSDTSLEIIFQNRFCHVTLNVFACSEKYALKNYFGLENKRKSVEYCGSCNNAVSSIKIVLQKERLVDMKVFNDI